MNKFAQLSALAATAGLATAGSLDLDRSYAAELRSDAGAYSVLNSSAANLQVTAAARFGYGINMRDNGGFTNSDNETTVGFGFQDVEVRLTGQVTDSINATISFDFGPDENRPIGNDFDSSFEENGVNLEDAYADWTVNDGFSLRIGQFIQAFSAGRNISEYHMMGAFRSSAQSLLGDNGYSQGIEAHFGGDNWGAAVGFSDGPRSANTAFNDAILDDTDPNNIIVIGSGEADYAINGRFDFYSDSDKARFDDRAAWRGQSAGWRVGAGGFWASFGDTNPSGPENEFLSFTVDGAYEADGWGLNAALFWQNVDLDGAGSDDNFGIEIGANMFFSDQLEGFARYDVVVFDEDFGGSTEDTFQAISLGVNYYFVPESHAAKFTADLGWAFDDTRGLGSETGGSPFGGGFLGDSDGEINLSLMLQFMF
jgi:hypothetical protein